jgi:hypothetical protein
LLRNRQIFAFRIQIYVQLCAQVSDVAMVRTTLRIRMARRMPEFITGNEIRDVRAAARLSQPKFAALAEVSTRTICLTFRRIARAMLKAAHILLQGRGITGGYRRDYRYAFPRQRSDQCRASAALSREAQRGYRYADRYGASA